ncbi:MAG TPA: SDR family oxidoreductase [Candidatus Kapabacteria bacterium]|nr:SDR family oxidoreductase [Candidatus Kapabacteria bacterium]
MECLVTGGAGFIGTNLVRALLDRGDRVRVLDNFSTGKRENLRDIDHRLELIEGDVRSYHLVREAVEGMDVIFHQAALPSVPRSIRDPITTHEVGVNGTLNVLQAARDCKVGRVIFASSSSVYGNTEELPKHEKMTPTPLSPYAVSKLSGEHYCQVFFRLYGLQTVALRYFNIFGPRQDPNSLYSAVIPRFIETISRGDSPTIFGDGEQSRDFTYVENVVRANFLAAQAESGVAGEVFNVACHDRITLNRLVQALNEGLGTSVAALHAEPRLGDVRHSFASIEKFRAATGYEPAVAFAEGIGRTIEWFRATILEAFTPNVTHAAGRTDG